MMIDSSDAHSHFVLPATTDRAIADLLEWIEHLPSLGLQHAVPGLILRLERLRESPAPLATRFHLLRLLKGAVLKIAAALTAAPAADARVPFGLSMDQRLYEAIARNCQHLLAELDRVPFDVEPLRIFYRYWTVRNAFRFAGRQLLGALESRRPWPPGAWLELHRLYVSLVVRGNYAETLVQGGGQRFEPERIYKRLLATGLAADHLVDGSGQLDAETMRRLVAIADRSALVDPEVLADASRVALVDVTLDRPPRWHAGPLPERVQGWALRTPPELDGLIRHLAAARASREAVAA